MRRVLLLPVAALVCACETRVDSHARAAAPPVAAHVPAHAGSTAVVAPPTTRRGTRSVRPDTGAASRVSVRAPAPALPRRIRPLPAPNPIRGLYVSRAVATSPAIWRLVALARRTEINALVIDVKNDHGLLLYPSTVWLAHAVGADTGGVLPVARFHALMDSLRRHHLFAVARIVVGHDPLLAAHHPEWDVRRREDGQPWRDSTGALVLDPAHREPWAYAADLASEAAARGFSEVMFDDLGFPNAPGVWRDGEFALRNGEDPTEVLRDNLAYLGRRTEPLGIPMALALAGTSAADSSAVGAGSRWSTVAGEADMLMPFEFPSMFPAGSFGYADPAEHPYEVVFRALTEARRRTAGVPDAGRIVPWYQDFSAGGVAFDSARVRAEIRGGYAAGIQSWMLWNAAGAYTEAALHEPERRDSVASKRRGGSRRARRGG